MNNEFNFKVEPFKFQPEFENTTLEVFDTELADQEWEGEWGRSRQTPIRPARYRQPPLRPRRPPVRSPRPPLPPYRSPRRPGWPSAVVDEPPGVVPAPEPEGSEYVRWVQNTLNQVMSLRLPVDGIMGPETRSAIRSFQQRQGLSADGIFGPSTEAALIAASGDQPPGASAEFEAFDAELADQELELSGSCPDVPVPASQRPRVLVRDSVHSAVREAQRKLNAFHAYRLAAGLPGLRDAPLVEDCILGRHTYEAVKSFQELVFPGMPVEHDGKIGSHTWAQLDAIVLGPGPSPAAQLTVEQLRITDDGFAGPLSWDQVIGLDTATLNLELIASGLPPATMPAQIEVELSSRVPNRVSGATTLGTPVKLSVPRFRADLANPNRIVYRLSRPLADIGDFLKVERQLKEMATIVRSGGTSDVEFRRALGWNPRGIATQPVAVGTSTGSESSEIPDAFALFRSAGVEVLQLRVPVQPNWRIPGAVIRLIRSPADVVYYSGHGLSASGKLALDIENKPCGEHGTYRDWLGPADLTSVWTSPMDLDLLILAGCSVLKIDFSTSPASGPGMGWARLLRAKGGPLAALLGYQRGAPCDSPNGERIARQMGQRMAGGSTNFARDWLEVNGDNNANNAVAMDARGYWWIEGTWTGGYDIKGPKAIP